MTKKNIDINKVADLANLKLSKEENDKLALQLEEVLGYISVLNKLNTKDIEPIGHITGLESVSREDEPRPSLTQLEATKNTKKIHNGFFEVDAIFEEQDQ